MLRFDDRVWLLWAVWLLLLPLNWLVAAAAAACVHELCHIGAVLMLRGEIRGITVGPFGAVIEADGIGGYREAVCALAGPVGSLLLALVIRKLPVLGLCALVQGVFNLLPVYPMDGGRTLRCLLEEICPEKAELSALTVEIVVFLLIFVVSAVCALRFSLGCAPVVFCALAIASAILRKRP